MIGQINRAGKCIRMARADWSEARHYVPAARVRTRRAVKLVASRAARRMGHALTREQVGES